MDKIQQQKRNESISPIHGFEMWKNHLQRMFILTTLLEACIDFNRVSELTPTDMKAVLLPIQKRADLLLNDFKAFKKYVKAINPKSLDEIVYEMSNDRIWDLCEHIDTVWMAKNISDITGLLRANMVIVEKE
jgi:hypothetical protein